MTAELLQTTAQNSTWKNLSSVLFDDITEIVEIKSIQDLLIDPDGRCTQDWASRVQMTDFHGSNEYLCFYKRTMSVMPEGEKTLRAGSKGWTESAPLGLFSISNIIAFTFIPFALRHLVWIVEPIAVRNTLQKILIENCFYSGSRL